MSIDIEHIPKTITNDFSRFDLVSVMYDTKTGEKTNPHRRERIVYYSKDYGLVHLTYDCNTEDEDVVFYMLNCNDSESNYLWKKLLLFTIPYHFCDKRNERNEEENSWYIDEMIHLLYDGSFLGGDNDRCPLCGTYFKDIKIYPRFKYLYENINIAGSYDGYKTYIHDLSMYTPLKTSFQYILRNIYHDESSLFQDITYSEGCNNSTSIIKIGTIYKVTRNKPSKKMINSIEGSFLLYIIMSSYNKKIYDINIKNLYMESEHLSYQFKTSTLIPYCIRISDDDKDVEFYKDKKECGERIREIDSSWSSKYDPIKEAPSNDIDMHEILSILLENSNGDKYNVVVSLLTGGEEKRIFNNTYMMELYINRNEKEIFLKDKSSMLTDNEDLNMIKSNLINIDTITNIVSNYHVIYNNILLIKIFENKTMLIQEISKNVRDMNGLIRYPYQRIFYNTRLIAQTITIPNSEVVTKNYKDFKTYLYRIAHILSTSKCGYCGFNIRNIYNKCSCGNGSVVDNLDNIINKNYNCLKETFNLTDEDILNKKIFYISTIK